MLDYVLPFSSVNCVTVHLSHGLQGVIKSEKEMKYPSIQLSYILISKCVAPFLSMTDVISVTEQL